MSIFSTINNLTNVSMDKVYGITETEFETVFVDDVEHLAMELEVSTELCWADMKRWYDGYYFCND